MATLTIDGIRKSYGAMQVLNDIELEVEDGGFLVLLGPSGCGKSTLLSIIAGLESSSGGRVLIGNDDVTNVHPKDRNIAMVFQSYALYPTMPVRRNIGFGLEMRKVERSAREAAVDRTASMLQVSHLLDRKPGQLSGGQRQRVAMGRAIVREPNLFLFDEPLSNLDAKLRVEMRTEIKRLHEQLGTTIVYVTHDQVEAMTLGTRVAVMRNGVIEQMDDPQTIYDRPATTFVAAFIGSPSMNFLRGTLAQGPSGWTLSYGTDGRMHFGALNGVGVEERQLVDVGIRPEALSRGQGGTMIEGVVDVVEPTGPDTMVVLKSQGTVITARLGPRDRPVRGETIALAVDTATISVFAAETGRRL
jgi:multiple sugar transport system ATP-binding protein